MDLNYFLLFVFMAGLIVSACSNLTKIESINVFAVGRRSFSTFALTCTIIATWVSGSGFFITLTKFYKDGWEYLLPALCMSISLLIMAFFIVPRMKKFLGHTSVASIMGKHYGETARIITAISGAIGVSGLIAVQFKVFGNILTYFWKIDFNLAVIISSAFVIVYSAIGGIKSVVRTDIIQGICFSISIIIAITILSLKITPQTPQVSLDHFNFSRIFYLPSDKFLNMILLALYFFIPGMNPATVQRISMGYSIQQIKRSWIIASIMLIIIKLSCAYIVYLLFQLHPNLSVEKLLPTLMDIFTIPGTKAILVIGVISMAMSTADSFLNIAAVLIANDTYKANVWHDVTKLYVARICTFIIGAFAIFLTTLKEDIVSLLLCANSFYIPIVTIPLLALIFEYKTTSRVCLIAMGVSFCFVLTCHLIQTPFEPLVPGMGINTITLISSHYIIEKWNLLAYIGIKSQLKKE